MTITIWRQVLNETSQAYELRKPMLSKVSKHFQNRLVLSFYTRFGSQATISDGDASMLTNMLSSSKEVEKKKILLVINSPGGDPLAAEKIIKVLSEFSGTDYWVLVPGVAKSAATMICLGSNRIIMSPVSELGPIDLQVVRGEKLIPAFSIITAYDKLMVTGMNLNEKQRIEPILQQLQDFNPSEIEYFRKINELAGDIAFKILKKGMLKRLSKKKIEELIKIFLDPGESKVHGRPIFYSDIKEIDKNNDLKLKLIETTDDIWGAISEYHLRMLRHLAVTDCQKILESEEGSFRVG